MQLRIGYEFLYEFPQSTPLILTLNVHYSRASDLVTLDQVRTVPTLPASGFRDVHGNWCQRVVAPEGSLRIWSETLIHDNGYSDPVAPNAWQHPVEQLPEETLQFLLGSRYCETDRLTEFAWAQFAHTPLGWPRVQAVCDFVHEHLTFGYEFANPTLTAFQAFEQRRGVCRDYAHLAVTLCRCLNIPARYCTGYLSDVGVPPPYAPMDFAGWFEAFLDGAWWTFDPRNNEPRIGRVLVARGRDAADVPLITTFGPNDLRSFQVIAEPTESC